MQLNHLSGTGVAGNAETTISVRSNQLKRFLYGQIVLTTDATVANRRVVVSVQDSSGNVLIDLHAGAVVAASQTSQHHELLQGIYRETSFVGGALQIPVPEDMYVPPTYSLVVSIENGVVGDSYDYSLMFEVEHVIPSQTMVD